MQPHEQARQLSAIPLLVSLVKRDHQAARHHLSRGKFDVDLFYRFIMTHQLRGYTYTLVLDSPARDAFPPNLLKHLKELHRRQAERSNHLVKELIGLSNAFSRERLQFILLKGPHLAVRFYDGLDRRIFWDLDILVRNDDFADAARLLGRCGFRRTSWVVFHEGLTRAFTHAFDFGKDGLTIDLHWALANRPSFKINYGRVWETREPFLLNDVTFSVLSNDYTILLTIISIFRDIETGKLRLRSLVDLYLILKTTHNQIDWERFFAEREAENLLRVSTNVLDLFTRLFDCRTEFPELRRALSQRHASLTIPDDEAARALVGHGRVGLKRRLWASRLYEASRTHVFSWWAISLPFRRAVFRTGKLPRLRRAVSRWRRSPAVRRHGASARD
jgi:hypothetical protein